jgi:hypothetical protein
MAQPHKLRQISNGMDDSWMVFVQYWGKTPAMASCAKCHLKFFTPRELQKKPNEATDYLWRKFAAHPCKWEEAISGDHPRRLRIVTANVGICGSAVPVYKAGILQPCAYIPKTGLPPQSRRETSPST